MPEDGGEVQLPAHVEALGLIRQAQAQGGFGTVIQKGERDAGTIIVVLTENGTNARVYERLPGFDGTRNWHLSKQQDPEKPEELGEYLMRRARQDSDTWIVELDIANGERLIGLPPPLA
jgi:hypothetical protein